MLHVENYLDKCYMLETISQSANDNEEIIFTLVIGYNTSPWIFFFERKMQS